jgi:hypothetical protein
MEVPMAARTWPTREEWAAKAEHSVRTVCYTSQRVSQDPQTWLSTEQLAEATRLVNEIVKASRREINRRVRENIDTDATPSHRRQLNSANTSSKSIYRQVDTLARDWSRLAEVGNAMGAAPKQADRLASLCAEMLRNRDAAAQADLDTAIAREVAKRNTDAGWAAELERRASIEAGPLVTRH